MSTKLDRYNKKHNNLYLVTSKSYPERQTGPM